MQREQVAEEIGCSTESLRRWYVEGKKQGLVAKPSKAEATTKPGKAADSSATTKPAAATNPQCTSAAI